MSEIPSSIKKTIDYAPENMSEEERSSLLSMNITEEFNEISRNLDNFHSIFYQIWEMGQPRLTFEIGTAAVVFNRKGHRIDFLFNPIYWKSIDTYTKEFVICHECLHVILNHGIRSKDIRGNRYLQKLANHAFDIVVNHMLVDKFNFNRKSINEQEKLCWIDTVFDKDHKNVEKNRAFEYYFGLLKQKTIEDLKSGKIKMVFEDGSSGDMQGECIDMHDFFDSLDNESIKNEIEEHINNNLNDLDKNNFIDKLKETGEGSKVLEKTSGNEAGSLAANILFKMNIHEKVKKKSKWETVIKRWSMKFLKEDQDVEQWTRLNRRISGLSTNLLLPSENDDQHIIQDKIEVWFFQDVSGSCVSLKDRFFRAARSLPEDKFMVRMFCFDTEVHEVDLKKGELKGGGGTSFSILENYVQKQVISGVKHPEAIFVITDGVGNKISPKFPKKWYWFLSINHRDCIPKECNIHMLKNFE